MKKIGLLILTLLFSPCLWAKKGALIDMPGPKPQVASAWKSLGPGKYEFTIDASKGFSTADVKASLEKRLKRSFSVVVTPQGGKVVVAYKGDEAKFLKKLSKVKIRKATAGSVTVAETRADGGIRADSTSRTVAAGEVRAKVLSVSGATANVMPELVSKEATAQGITKRPIKIKASGLKANKVIYFKPNGKEGTTWKVKDIKDK